MSKRQSLRCQLRERRRALALSDRIDASLALSRHLVTLLARVRYGRIAGYVAADAEADPGPFIAAARELGRDVYLPVLQATRKTGLRFVRTEAGQALAANRFGIPEPQAGREARPRDLDLVLVPLVGFDRRGNRLGMGAGYYDRSFAFRRLRARWRRPTLLGVAYDCQRVGELDAEHWDVPLDGVVTETGLEWFRQR